MGMSMKNVLLNNQFMLNAAFWWKCRIESKLRHGRPQQYKKPAWHMTERVVQECKQLHMALIADEMTYQNFCTLCQIHLLSPQNWRDVLEKEKPDVFFCESAWSGTTEQKDCWRYQIYGRSGLWFENRKTLYDIIKYCREAGIPTVFWNKEDPAYFGDDAHNFVATASWFDFVLTTAEECIDAYHKMGFENVGTMPFGYSPDLFYPLPGEFDCGRAVFFGSWYQDQPVRCQDMIRLFDMVLDMGMNLEIYDRHAYTDEKRFTYPEKYRPYVRSGVSYIDIPSTIGRPCYAINVNTVMESETMYARRVLELMACGCIIISNESIGLRRRFGNRIWFCEDDFDNSQIEQIRTINQEEVQLNDAWEIRLNSLFLQMGLIQQ